MDRWAEIYARVYDATYRSEAEVAAANRPVVERVPSRYEATLAEWQGNNWFGRIMFEDLNPAVETVRFGRSIATQLALMKLGEEQAYEPIKPSEMDLTGIEEYAAEIYDSRTWLEYEVKRSKLLERKFQIQKSLARDGVMHKFLGHLIDPTIVVGAGVGLASLGQGALRAGVRVGAVEAGIVGVTEGVAAARYADRTALDAVKASAFAGIFGASLGALGAGVSGRRVGRLWAGTGAGSDVRASAAGARQQTMEVIEQTTANSNARAERVAALYEKPKALLRSKREKLDAQIRRAQEKWQLSDLSDEALDEAYQAGGRSERVAIQRLRQAIQRKNRLVNEDELFLLEEAIARTADSPDGWKTDALGALMGSRSRAAAMMLPRLRATQNSALELKGVAADAGTAEGKAVGIIKRIRQAARQMTKSHGLDRAMDKLQGASVEDHHLQEITQMLRTDEELRTLAIRSISDGITQGTVTRHIKNDVLGWGLRKATELPYVLTPKKFRKTFDPRIKLQTTEDVLENFLEEMHARALDGGDVAKMEYPQAVKDLYIHRQNEYKRLGDQLRELELTWVQKNMRLREADIQARRNLADRDLAEMEQGRWPVNSKGERPRGKPSEAAVEKQRELIARLDGQLEELADDMERYKSAINEKYAPIRLVADKVRQDKKGFIEKAMEHFLENPVASLRHGRKVQRHVTANDAASREGRAVALWHATVNRVDYAGRPLSQQDFVARLDRALLEIIEEYGLPRHKFVDKEGNWLVDLDSLEEIFRNVPGDAHATRVGKSAFRSLFTRKVLIQENSLSRESGGRYMQSELFESMALDPRRFKDFIENRPTVQYRSYLEREIRRLHAARVFGDPDGMNPIHKSVQELEELKAEGVSDDIIRELEERIDAYDSLRRQTMGEPVIDSSNQIIDHMNRGVDFLVNLSTATDLGMAGWSVSVDLAQMLSYYGIGPMRLAKLAKSVFTDSEFRKLVTSGEASWQLGVAGEIVRGARLRAIQGGDQFFGGGEGFVMTDRYFSNVLSWFNHTYQEAASNIMTASLLNPITDMIQKLAAPLATTRVMHAIIRVAQDHGTRVDRNVLNRLGIDEDMAKRVFAQFHDGEKKIFRRSGDEAPLTTKELLDPTETMILPKFETWADQSLAQEIAALIGSDIRTATLHPSIASNRIWKGMGAGLLAVSRLYYLFTRWAFMAQQNIYGKNVEDRTFRHIANAMMYATIVQMIVNWRKEPDWVEESYLERAKDAFVMSGALGYMGILNERLERLSGHQLGIRPMLGMDTFAHDPDHLGFRASGLSPVTGKLGGMYQSIENGQFGRLGRLFTPYQNWWLWAGAVRDGSELFDMEQE